MKSAVLAIVLVASSGCNREAASSHSDPKRDTFLKYHSEAIFAFSDGNTAAARAWLAKAKESAVAKADLAVVYYLEGQIDIREGQFARAEGIYNSAIEADPTKGLLFLCRAECLLRVTSDKQISDQEKQTKLRQLDLDLKEAVRLDPTLKDKAESIRKQVRND